MNNFNKLTDAELERLALIGEECSEVGQIIGKIIRHGFDRYHPNGGVSNREHLQKEIGDALGVIDFAIKRGDLDLEDIEYHRRNKMKNTAPYLHHNEINDSEVLHMDDNNHE